MRQSFSLIWYKIKFSFQHRGCHHGRPSKEGRLENENGVSASLIGRLSGEGSTRPERPAFLFLCRIGPKNIYIYIFLFFFFFYEPLGLLHNGDYAPSYSRNVSIPAAHPNTDFPCQGMYVCDPERLHVHSGQPANSHALRFVPFISIIYGYSVIVLK